MLIPSCGGKVERQLGDIDIPHGGDNPVTAHGRGGDPLDDRRAGRRIVARPGPERMPVGAPDVGPGRGAAVPRAFLRTGRRGGPELGPDPPGGVPAARGLQAANAAPSSVPAAATMSAFLLPR